VSEAIYAFITFQGREPYNPDYPMHQFVPEHLQVSRGFREHCPPGFMHRRLLYTWTYERQNPLFMMPRPLKSEYTQELLVHPHFLQRGGNLELRHANVANPRQLIVVDENSLDDAHRQGPRRLAFVPAGETGAMVGTAPRRGDFNMSDGGRYE